MTQVPTWFAFVLLALASFRIVRLVAWDDLTTTLRTRVLGVSDTEHHELARDIDAAQEAGDNPWEAWPAPPPISRRRFYFSRLVRCPWCLSVWCCAAIWGAWLVWPGEVTFLAVPFALAASVGLIAKNGDP